MYIMALVELSNNRFRMFCQVKCTSGTLVYVHVLQLEGSHTSFKSTSRTALTLKFVYASPW
jgi:hypothetical protein